MTGMRATWFFVFLAALAVVEAKAQGFLRREPTGVRKTFEQGGLERVYRIHVPKSYDGSRKVPLVLFLHGGAGDADIGSRTGVTPLADKYGFIVVYPEGINKHWNDGRDSVRYREHDAKIDDVAFIRALVKSLQTRYKIDAGKIFAAGASNGGFMSHRLALEMSDVFSGAGIFIATLGKPLKEKFRPQFPVSMFFMNGTEDPLIPYDGGEVTVDFAPRLKRKQPSRGICVSTEEAVGLWVQRNKLGGSVPQVEQIPDKDQADGCTAESTTWSDPNAAASVVLYRVEGGGHTIPGGKQYLPKRLIGNTCGDFDGLEAMWHFFETQGRKPVILQQSEEE